MGQITRADIINLLRDENREGHEHDFAIYADAFLSYQAAAKNIADHGDIVAHPRTGAPIENPYGVIRDKSAVTLRKIGLNVGNLWEAPLRWLVAVTEIGAKSPPDGAYEVVLARDANEAAQMATYEQKYPVAAFVKSDAGEQWTLIIVSE